MILHIYVGRVGGGDLAGMQYTKKMYYVTIRFKHFEDRIIWSFCVLTIIVYRYLPIRLYLIFYIMYTYKKKKMNNRKYDQNISIDKFFLIILLVN